MWCAHWLIIAGFNRRCKCDGKDRTVSNAFNRPLQHVENLNSTGKNCISFDRGRLGLVEGSQIRDATSGECIAGI